MVEAMSQYRKEVKEGEFPAEEHCYRMPDEEYEKI